MCLDRVRTDWKLVQTKISLTEIIVYAQFIYPAFRSQSFWPSTRARKRAELTRFFDRRHPPIRLISKIEKTNRLHKYNRVWLPEHLNGKIYVSKTSDEVYRKTRRSLGPRRAKMIGHSLRRDSYFNVGHWRDSESKTKTVKECVPWATLPG